MDTTEASDRVLHHGAQLMRTSRLAEELQLSWGFRLRCRGAIERFLAKHDLTWNQVAVYESRTSG